MEKSEPQNSSFQQEKDVVSLGNYVFALASWWRESVLGMILAGVGGAGLLLTVELILPRYESFCDVAVIPTEANVSIDDTLRMATASVRARHFEAEARREGLLGLVNNGSVARAVAERLRNRWGEKNPKPAELLEQIHSRLVVSIKSQNRANISDLIRITARADRAEKAAALADAWADEYVKHVNVLYQQVPENVLHGVASELTAAREAYTVTQRKLESFIANDPTPQLERLIDQKRNIIESIKEIRAAATQAHFSKIRNNFEGRSFFESTLAAGRNAALKETYETLRILYQLRAKSRALRLQIKNGGEGPVHSNYVPLLLLKAEAFGSLSKLSDALDINLDGTYRIHANLAEQEADVDAFIEALEDLYMKTTEDLTKLTQSLFKRASGRMDGSNTSPLDLSDGILIYSPLSLHPTQTLSQSTTTSLTFDDDEFSLPALEEEIQTLVAKKEKSDAMLKHITQERDIQRSALESLQNESIELQLTRASASAQVRLAAQAVLATDTIYPSPLLIAFLGGSAGLLAMMGLALAANGTGVRPPLERLGPLRSKKRGDDR